MRLDKSLPFGVVSGIADHRYIQSGHKFNVQGDCIDKVKTNYTQMKNEKLRALLTVQKVEWTTRQDAIAWLKAN